MKQELLKGLTEEQIAKVKACKSQSELLELAKTEGITLTDEQLEAVSGGSCGSDNFTICPKCMVGVYMEKKGDNRFKCPNCDNYFTKEQLKR